MCECSAPIHVCISHAVLVPTETRRGHRIPEDDGKPPCGVLEMKPRLPVRVKNVLNCWDISPAPDDKFLNKAHSGTTICIQIM